MASERIMYQGKIHALFNILSFGFPNAFSYFKVTNRRVEKKTGIFIRDIDEHPLNRITAVEVDQGFWGKVLGFGTVKIYRNGDKKPTLLEKLSDPRSFREAVNNARAGMELPTAA